MTMILLLLALLLRVPAADASVLITSVEVDVGSSVWCNAGNASPSCLGATTLWNFGAGLLLTAGQTLVLTSTETPFDTSDACGTARGGCAAPRVVVNGVAFTDSAHILAGQSTGLVDPINAAFNEAADWRALGSTPLFSVSAGYADTVHTDPCADATHDCHPNAPWTDATVFLGPAGPGFDAGAVLIRAVPVPATWLLMGLGLGVSGWALHRRR